MEDLEQEEPRSAQLPIQVGDRVKVIHHENDQMFIHTYYGIVTAILNTQIIKPLDKIVNWGFKKYQVGGQYFKEEEVRQITEEEFKEYFNI